MVVCEFFERRCASCVGNAWRNVDAKVLGQFVQRAAFVLHVVEPRPMLAVFDGQ
jgi:hypothetical protein